jgi:hypothetical protein
LIRHIPPKIFPNPNTVQQPVTVHPELVEGCVATPFMLRQAQHERLKWIAVSIQLWTDW